MALCDKEWIMASTVRSETEEFPKPAVQRIYGDVSFLSHWAFMLITLCVNVRLTVFHFYQSYINFKFFWFIMMRLIACLFSFFFCPLLFCFLSPCDFTIFLVAGLIFIRECFLTLPDSGHIVLPLLIPFQTNNLSDQLFW